MKKLFLALIACTSLHADVIVFDVAGVLFETDAEKVTAYHQSQGMLALMNASKQSSITLHSMLLAAQPFDHTRQYIAKDSKGNFLAPIIVDWLTDRISSEQLHQKIESTLAQANCTDENRQRILYEARCILDPKLFVHTRKRIMPMIQLLQQLARKRHVVLLCSNWDAPSFELSRQSFPEIFDHVTDAINSCNTQIIKPDPAIFRLIKQKYPLNNGERYIFIDDQEENRIVAEQEGFVTAHPDKAYTLFALRSSL